jgi:hypothetical protein
VFAKAFFCLTPGDCHVASLLAMTQKAQLLCAVVKTTLQYNRRNQHQFAEISLHLSDFMV